MAKTVSSLWHYGWFLENGMKTFWQDIKFALRMIKKKPGYAVLMILTLALGIAANTAIFSIIYAVMLKPLPYRDPDRLVALYRKNLKRAGGDRFSVSFPNLQDWRTSNQVFETVGGFRLRKSVMSADSLPERVMAGMVTEGFFPTLGVTAVLGRLFNDAECIPGNPPQAILSYGLWQRRFGGRNDILGKTITIFQDQYSVIGVLPKNFNAFDIWSTGFQNVELWTTIPPSRVPDLQKRNWIFTGIARLKPAASLGDAQINLSLLDHSLAEQYAEYDKGFCTVVENLPGFVFGHLSRSLLALLGAVGFVLLIACTNVANLLLARASEREKEIAIRISLGASKWQLCRQLLTECLVLALAGGLAGLLIAGFSFSFMNAFLTDSTLGIPVIHLDTQVFGYTIFISLLTCLVFGSIPALEIAKTDLNTAIMKTNRGLSSTPFRQRLKNALVIVEMSISLLLLIGAGLLIKSFVQVWATDPGFKSNRVLTMTMYRPDQSGRPGGGCEPTPTPVYQQLLDRIEDLPGVISCGLTSVLPDQSGSNNSFQISRRPQPSDANELPRGNFINVSSQYFKTLGIPLKHGRFFSNLDAENAPKVAIINEALAKKYWGNQDPLRERLFIDGAWAAIVGIVGDVRQNGLLGKPEPTVYVSYFQDNPGFARVVVRTQTDPALLAAALRHEVQSTDKNQITEEIRTLNKVLLLKMESQQLVMYTLGAFSLLALIMAISGIYGVVRYWVSMRTHEIGIRMALGATQKQVMRMVLGQGMRLILIGLFLGIVASLGLTKFIASLLPNLTPTDPSIFVAVSMVLVLFALLACFIPAQRATRIDPIIALRQE